MKFAKLLLIPLAWAGVMASVSAQEAAESNTKDLTVQQYPRYYYSNQTRNPGFTILFNQEVSIDKAAQSMFFEDKDGKAVTVDVRQANDTEIAEHWKYYGGTDTNSPPAKQFLRVSPSRPLPVGNYWKLVLTDELTSKGGDFKLAKRNSFGAGTVRPFQITSAYVSNPYNEVPTMRVYFSKSIDHSIRAQLEDRFINLSPRPENFRMEVEDRGVTFFGDFEYGKEYVLDVKAGLLGTDGLELEAPYKANLTFQPREAFITLPDYDIAQPRTGEGTFRVLTGNLQNVRVRVKQLDGDSLIYALRGYKVYDPQHVDWEVGQRLPAYEMVAGRTIYDETFEMKGKIDTTEDMELKWEDIVPDGSSAGLYLSVEGVSRDHPGMALHRVGAHSIIQLTDLGMAWKQSRKDALFYVFSLRTGKPMANTEVTLFDSENQQLNSYRTGSDGTVQIPLSGSNEKTNWVIAKTEDDRYGTSFEAGSQEGISTWQFDIRQLYWGEPSVRLRSYIFSDRDIYKPGETVHIKAITRVADGEELAVPNKAKGFNAKLVVTDGRGREIVDREVTFSENGTLDYSFGLPQDNYGYYQVRFDFEDIAKEFALNEDDIYDQYAYHGFNVADYRPNTFEVSVDAPRTVSPGEEVQVSMKANYYRGKPLSKAQANWYASFHPSNFRPEGYEGFVFGEWDSDNNWTSDANTVELAEDGTAKVNLDFIPRDTLEQPVRVSFNADVTDINQQTISQSQSFLVHSSSYYLGLKLPDGWLDVKDRIKVEALPVTTKGDVMEANLDSRLVVERKVWNSIKVQGADGEMRHRNEWSFEKVADEPFPLQTRKDGDAPSTMVKVDDPGQYRFTLTTTDENGKTIKTVSNRYIYGDNDVWWAQKDGDIIDLVVDDKEYTVGETARIMVRSPILGTALVTTERAGVYRTIPVQLTTKNQFIDIPITSGDAPNLFVSVIVIRGSADSTHRFQDTDHRIGYAELKVHRPSDHLEVAVEVAQEEILPQQKVDLVATIKDYQGEPVRNAEVTLYAVDEGVLSLTNYQNPEPSETFLAPYPLLVRTWHTLFDVLPENPDDRSYGNKGLLIGGGAEGIDALSERTRKDFRATAYWNGQLVTDDDGKAKASFEVPDNLTEYRIIAVALNRADQYGVGTSKMIVTKPVIVEPAMPAFANVGDEHMLQAVVHNTTDQAGTFEVTLKADDKIEILKPDYQIVPAALDSPTSEPSVWKQKIDLKAGETSSLPIPVRFTSLGKAAWTWSIEDVENPKGRKDTIETKLNVGYPVPLLREMHHVKIEPGQPQNLLASFGKDLLNGTGEIDVTISNSRLLEAQDALEFNLEYPYGCVEQTTSSTLPWLTMNNLSKVFPSLDKDPEYREKAINYGLNRVLSMQTYEGGLGYWPGTDRPDLWASAWGGFGLLVGQSQGYPMPEERLKDIWAWMSEQLRNTDELDEPYELHHRCVALYTLALAGHPEPAYHELLYNKRKSLAPESRAFLALAILEGGTPAQRSLVDGLLVTDKDSPDAAAPWYGKGMPVSAKLMAELKRNPKGESVDQLLNELLRLRRPPYGWGSTYANAWPLVALSKLADVEGQPTKASRAVLAWEGSETPIELGKQFESQVATFSFDGDVRDNPLEVVASRGDILHVNLEVSAYPAELSAEPQDKGFKVRRSYHKLAPDGSMEQATNFTVGDLVVVNLELEIPTDNEDYLAIDDPLPSVFEAINPAFENRANADTPLNRWKQLPRDFEEIRQDRALFFCDHLRSKDTYSVQYLARVVASGSVTAPPAKIEAMYEPQRHGLSATERITATLPKKAGDAVALK